MVISETGTFQFIFAFINRQIFTHLASYESEVAASVRGLLRSTLLPSKGLELRILSQSCLIFWRK